MAIEAAHFGTALRGEAEALWKIFPGYLSELFRSGFYPSDVSFRKLPYFPERGDLAELHRRNREWTFREDFDPASWVLVFLHGYVDNTGAIAIANLLAARGYQIYLVRYPYLRGVERLAGDLADALERIAEQEPGKRIVPVGHSLGGFVWDHLLLHRPELVRQHRMPLYVSMGSPRQGTFAAYLALGESGREMRPGSALLADHRARRFAKELELYPFISRFDLFVLPIETALHQAGINYVFSETGHLAQVARREAAAAIEEILATPRTILEERASRRPFWPSVLTWALGQLPRSFHARLGIEGIVETVFGDGVPDDFRLRIVHHELRTGTLPILHHPPARSRR